MRHIANTHTTILYAMAWLAGLLMVAMMVTIVIDVVLRNLGFQSSSVFFTFSEYSLLLIPCLGAPWLVREKGHVFVEILLMYLRPVARFRATQVIGVASIVVCAVVAWYGFEVTIRDFTEGRQDTRVFDTPRWLLVIWIPLSFLMMAIEFARFLARGEDFLGSMGASVNPAKE
jgi:C4-dicarboxylate transporter, DctQ subunit